MHISDGLRAYGIYGKAVIILVFVPFFLVGLNCIGASPQETMDSASRVSLEDSVFVAGVFHYVDVTVLSENKNICIIAFSGDTEPELQNRSDKNYYRWECDDGVWKDTSGYDASFIEPSKCSKENNTYSFYIGISTKANPGGWTFKILVDDKETSSLSLQVIVGNFCLFFSTIIGVFEPTVQLKTLRAENELGCGYTERKLEANEKNIGRIVDRILERRPPMSREENPLYKNLDFYSSSHNPISSPEPVRSAISQYQRSKLKEGTHNENPSLSWGKAGGGDKDFFSKKLNILKRIFLIVVGVLLLSTSMLPMVVLTDKNKNTSDITVINVQSYPLIGGTWVVMFTTVGQANLTITAVNGTTWSDNDENHDLKYLECRRGNETLGYQWMNESVCIPNFSSNITCYAISRVFTPGTHTLLFQFGNDTAYAYNLASENWLQTSTGDFNNGTKTNINVSSGSFHLNERYILRNFTRINNQGFEGSWLPSGWSESPSTSNWNRESDQVYQGTYSADFDGVTGGGASGNLLSPSMNCAGANVTAIYVKFWIYTDNAHNGNFYLDYYDGSAWDEITRLDNIGDGAWTQYSQKITDSQYFKSNFQIRWRVVTLHNNEHVYIDLINVTVERNESGYYSAGSLLSQAHDTTRNMPDYNNIIVSNSTLSGTTITTWIRSADIQANLSTATWYTAISQLPDKRWVQWRINLTGDTYRTPTVTEVNLTWTYDNEYPVSAVNSLSPYWQTTVPFQISVTATDIGTGIKEVALYYNYSANNASGWSGWTLYGTNDTTSPYAWSFTAPQGQGYYRFYSRAKDGELNIENPPSSPGFDTFSGVDTIKPSSRLENITPYWYVEPDRDVVINCSSANDSLSGLKNIVLYYRYRADNESAWGSWLLFESDENSPWSWVFNFPKVKGFYQFYSIANDNAGNSEDPPISPDNDTECAYNSTKPYSEVNDISPYWHGTSPLAITAQATDNNGSGLHNVSLYYVYSTDNNSWSSQLLFGVDTDPWVAISWSFSFPNGAGYYRFYSIAVDNDSNAEYFTGNDTICGYDSTKPSSQVDPITPYWHDAASNPTLVIVTNADDEFTGISNVTLYYRFRIDNTSGWNAWASFGTDENAPWNWSFNFPFGEGHYQFYSIAYDGIGNRENPPSSPEYDTSCGYDVSRPSSEINDISPYNVTFPPLVLTATADDDVKNVTVWYRYSTQNSTWWNSCWLYRKQLNISGKNGGYHMKIIIGNTSGGNVNCNGHVRSDFGDIRFISFSDNTTQLSYWRKNHTTGTQATFWVNNSRNDTSIWMYYGNSTATTTSNGENTFYFFDDFSNGLSKWTMDSWNTDSIFVNQSQGNPSPALKHLPDNSLPANRTYQDTRVRTSTYRMRNGTIEYDVYLAGTPRIIHQFGWRVNALSWTNGYSWRLQNANGDGGFFEFSAPTTWTSIGTTFPDAAVSTWYHLQVNVSGANYASIVNPACGGATTRSAADSTKLTADYLISHVHGVSMNATSYVLVDNIFVRKYRATPPTWSNFGNEEGWIRWNNGSNPDTSSPWSWNFDFPDGFGYYWFYSIAYDIDDNLENRPITADAQCHFIPHSAPIINSYDLRNSSGSKLNNATGLLDVNNEYYFTINVTAIYGWMYIDYIQIKTWYDEGSEGTSYNQTAGGNLNMYLQYKNISGAVNYTLFWPDDEAQIINANCSESIFNSSTRTIKISFKPLNQTRWASSNNTWNATKNSTNDLFSWNFIITVTDATGLTSWVHDEYGVYKFAAILPEKNWVDVRAPPGYNATSNVVNITYSSNYNFNISIYFEENLTNATSGDVIPIANNVYICANADLTDDITTDMMFRGIKEINAIEIINTSGIFSKNNTSQIVKVQFNVYIPFGTNQGQYTAHVATKIKYKEE